MTGSRSHGLSRQPGSLEQFGYLTARTLRSVVSTPSALILPIGFPILFLAINVEALGSASSLSGFPTDNMADFAIALAFLQGALFSAVMFSTDLAGEIESGFIARIALAPISAVTVLLSRLAAVAVFALLQIACFAAAGSIWGATLSAGPAEIPVLIALVLVINVGVATIGFQLALRSGSGEMTQSLFPIFFVLLLMSSALMPLELMDIAWYRTVAELNPISYLIDGIRGLYTVGWDPSTLITAAAVALAIGVAGTVASSVQLRSLLARHR